MKRLGAAWYRCPWQLLAERFLDGRATQRRFALRWLAILPWPAGIGVRGGRPPLRGANGHQWAAA